MFALPLSISEFAIVAVAALLAGLVRGFVGFGTAMVYLPIAGLFLSPVQALVTLTLIDLFGPIPVLRQVWPDAHRVDLRRLLIGVALALPLGIAALVVLNPEQFRTIVGFASLAMLLILITGWRYSGSLAPWAVYGTGGAAGFLGGVAGIPGPPVILIYMASPHPARVIRANTTLFLYGYDVMLLIALVVGVTIEWSYVWLGLLLIIPYLIGNLTGAALFVPQHERAFRWVAYLLIATSALIGLPIWG